MNNGCSWPNFFFFDKPEYFRQHFTVYLSGLRYRADNAHMSVIAVFVR